MDKTSVIVAGLPGKMASLVAARIAASEQFDLAPISLTGPGQPDLAYFPPTHVSLRAPEDHEASIHDFVSSLQPSDIVYCVDFTQPDAAADNAELYCENGIPFVMGTTGGDTEAIKRMVADTNNTAVVAPNMAVPVVLVQAMFQHAATCFTGALEGYTMTVRESHQEGKKDTSGTARAMVESFNKLGVDFTPDQIRMVRKPNVQAAMGIPERYLNGHGYHTYSLTSPDGTVDLEFKHNVRGREVYVDGTMLALRFLKAMLEDGKGRGRTYDMIDVISGW